MGVVPVSPPDPARLGFVPCETPVAAQDPGYSGAALPRNDSAQLARLLERVATRDAEAFSTLYDAMAPRVFAVARRIVGNNETAEEVVSDVFLQVWRTAARYDAARGSVQTWMLLICRSRALDALRRVDSAVAHPDPYLLPEAPTDTSSSGELLLEALERGARVREAVESLQPLDRQLIALAFFRDLTHSEIARHSGLPLGTVKSRIRHALRVLREGGIEPSRGP